MHIKKIGKRVLPLVLIIAGGFLLLVFSFIFFASDGDFRDEAAWLKTIFVITGFAGMILIIWGLYLDIKRELRAITKKRLEASLQQDKEALHGSEK
jgi:uncharacterized membrane protein YciS (DUF1049 family)